MAQSESKNDIMQEAKDLIKELNSVSEKKKSRLKLLEEQNADLQGKINQYESEQSRYKQDIAAAEEKVGSAEKKYFEMKLNYERLLTEYETLEAKAKRIAKAFSMYDGVVEDVLTDKEDGGK